MWSPLATASVVFLVLYLGAFVCLITGYLTRRFTIKSRWTFLLFHVTIRLAAQGVGVAFGILLYSQIGLLVAYLVLAAEGYFSLVLCTMRFLIWWQRRFIPNNGGRSWLEAPKEGATLAQKWLAPKEMIHWILIVANLLVVLGGSFLSSAIKIDVNGNATIDPVELAKSRNMRGAGQVLFLAVNLFLAGVLLYSLRTVRRGGTGEDGETGNNGRRYLSVLFAASALLLVRGVFAVCQAFIWSLNYYNPDNYDKGGLTSSFVAEESILATMIEFLTVACLLSSTLWADDHRHHERDSSTEDVEATKA